MKQAAIIIVVILIAIAASLLYGLSRTGEENPSSSSTPAPTPVVSDSGNISVTEPHPNDEIGVPLVVRGSARVFENVVNIRLRDEDGIVLVESFTTANAPDIGQFGPFEESLSYPEPNGDEGTLEVFSISAKDGSEINKVTIPVKFGEAETMSVKVFFSPQDIGNDCSKTVAVSRRIPKTEAPARAALNELFKGPSESEREEGLQTNINTGVTIQSLSITDGTANVDLSPELDQGVGGSCRVTAIRAQIVDTLKQFPTVDDVVISINGESETILQP